MKHIYNLLIAFCLSTMVHGQSLSISSGTVSFPQSWSASVSVTGPSTHTYVLELYDPKYAVWDSKNIFVVDSNGNANCSVELDHIWGCIRIKATNNAIYSENAFAFYSGTLNLFGGYEMIGNPFTPIDLTNVFPNPKEGLTVYKWNNANNSYQSASFEFGQWSTNFTIGTCEGILVFSPPDYEFPYDEVRYKFYGTFASSDSLSIPSGLSIICSPLFVPIGEETRTVDLLTTSNLGGSSLLPVQTPNGNPQCTINIMIDNNQNYQQYTLPNTNNCWYSNGQETSVPLDYCVGFWINKPTNAVWNISRSVW